LHGLVEAQSKCCDEAQWTGQEWRTGALCCARAGVQPLLLLVEPLHHRLHKAGLLQVGIHLPE
jgi:hypothetical protein